MLRLLEMRPRLIAILLLIAGIPLLVQNTPAGSSAPAAAQPALLTDPRAILSSAAPFYDFNDPSLKPWHLKATYQLYDEKGKPTEQGTFEYWWASPKAHRSTWTRPGVVRTDWYLADGRSAYVGHEQRQTFFEGQLQNYFFAPIPSAAETDPGKVRLVKNDLKRKALQLPCVSLVPKNRPETEDPFRDPTYCFDTSVPVLRVTYGSTGAVLTVYDNIAKFQGRFLARDIKILVGERTYFSVTVDTVEGLKPSDPALVPSTDAIFKPSGVSLAEVVEGMLIKKVPPEYPAMAKEQNRHGVVLVDAKIGVDGKIEDPQVISSPSPLLSHSSLAALAKWQYKPYLVDGTPVEVDTLIAVVYTLGR
jgi:TonB family protein